MIRRGLARALHAVAHAIATVAYRLHAPVADEPRPLAGLRS
jgi:hypothetical protein